MDLRLDLERSRELEEFAMEPPDHKGEPRWTKYNSIDPKQSGSLTDHQYFLLPPWTLGFALDIKEWSMDTLTSKSLEQKLGC